MAASKLCQRRCDKGKIQIGFAIAGQRSCWGSSRAALPSMAKCSARLQWLSASGGLWGFTPAAAVVDLGPSSSPCPPAGQYD
jgi:hypothetical protein